MRGFYPEEPGRVSVITHGMIVIVGSRHDAIAAALAEAWGGRVCTAEDLITPGWSWEVPGGRRTWIVGGAAVDDRDVTGVFVRRSTVHRQELPRVPPADRGYLAAELHGLLSLVLGTTAARVCNPVVDGAFGEEALRPARWLAAARACGIAVHPVRLHSDAEPRPLPEAFTVEVVGDDCHGGGAAARDRSAALALVSRLGLVWGSVAFDGRHRLLTVTARLPPSSSATRALGALLGASPSQVRSRPRRRTGERRALRPQLGRSRAEPRRSRP
jgi:hypothetical protein